MKELTTKDKKIIEKLQQSINDIDQIKTAEMFTAWQTRMDVVLSTALGEGHILVDEICCIEVMKGYTAIENLVAAKEEAIELLKAGIDAIEIKALDEPKSKKKQKQKKSIEVNVNTSVNNDVKQQVDLKIKFIVEALDGSFSKEQIEQLIAIQKLNISDAEKEGKFLETVKSFGLDVAAGFVVTVLTNFDLMKRLFFPE